MQIQTSLGSIQNKNTNKLVVRSFVMQMFPKFTIPKGLAPLTLAKKTINTWIYSQLLKYCVYHLKQMLNCYHMLISDVNGQDNNDMLPLK